MSMARSQILVTGILILCAFTAPASLHAQTGVGTWTRQDDKGPGTMTMTVDECCHGGRKLTYKGAINGNNIVLTVESPFDGSETPVSLNGKPTGETMAITKVDDHSTMTVLKFNGKQFGTSKATLSADGKTLTIVNDIAEDAMGRTKGQTTEIWKKN